jgi:hypothetical protein
MRRLGGCLAAAALALTVAACGSESGSEAGSSQTGVAFEQVALVTVTAGGGQVTEHATYVDDRAALRAYVDRFPSERLQREVLAAAADADLKDGQRLAAAVVGLGCTPPTRVSVSGADDDLRITASHPPSRSIQCIAPITTVALVAVTPSAS